MFYSANDGKSSSNRELCKITAAVFQNTAFMKKRPSNPVLPYRERRMQKADCLSESATVSPAFFGSSDNEAHHRDGYYFLSTLQ